MKNDTLYNLAQGIIMKKLRLISIVPEYTLPPVG